MAQETQTGAHILKNQDEDNIYVYYIFSNYTIACPSAPVAPKPL